MVDIQSATAEIRRGIKKDRKKPHGKNVMSASATQGSHNHAVIAAAIRQWHRRLSACEKAGGGHFEHLF